MELICYLANFSLYAGLMLYKTKTNAIVVLRILNVPWMNDCLSNPFNLFAFSHLKSPLPDSCEVVQVSLHLMHTSLNDH